MPRGTKIANPVYTVDDKNDAAMAYYQYGEYTEASRQIGERVPARTIKNWHDNCPIFQDGMKKAAGIADKRLGSKIYRAESLALDHVIEQLTDKETKKTIKARDAGWLAAVFHDKRLVLEGKASTISKSYSKGSNEELDALAKTLESRASESAKAQFDLKGSNITRFKTKKG